MGRREYTDQTRIRRPPVDAIGGPIRRLTLRRGGAAFQSRRSSVRISTQSNRRLLDASATDNDYGFAHCDFARGGGARKWAPVASRTLARFGAERHRRVRR